MAAKFENGTVVTPPRKQMAPSVSSEYFQLGKPIYTLKDMVLKEEQAKAIEEVLSLAKYETLIFRTWGLERVIKRGRGIKVNFYL